MELRNTKPKNLKDNKNDYSFMINDWQTYNEKPDDDYDDPDSAYEDNEKYIHSSQQTVSGLLKNIYI